jgi:hypothetical protein
MTHQVRPMSWHQLMESRFETQLYAYENLPTGTRRVLLEKSAWHRYQAAVIWFLRDLDSEKRYRISIFRNRQNNGYGPEQLDLAAVPSGTSLTIEIHQNRTGTFRIQGATVSSLPQA